MTGIRSWTTRPIFISSTFKDMYAERDWLQHHVFPRLAENLRERRLFLAPIDIRLGVETSVLETDESKELMVLKVCLDEIERSWPFLLVLLGDRYGWVPPRERTETAAREKGTYLDVNGKSVTALEIEFGILKEDPDQKHRSLFFFRKPLPYDRMPPNLAATYCDACSSDPDIRSGYEKLTALKKRLQDDPDLGSRVFEYDVAWDKNENRVTHLEAFGDLVYNHLWATLDEETTDFLSQPQETWEQEEHSLLLEFVQERSRGFVGRERTIQELLEFADPVNEGNWGACIIGPPGSGKSALFSVLFNTFSQTKNIFLLANTAGGTPRGSRVNEMLLWWIRELAVFLDITPTISEDPSPDDIDNVFYALLHQVSNQTQVILLLDALGSFEPTNRARCLTWLK